MDSDPNETAAQSNRVTPNPVMPPALPSNPYGDQTRLPPRPHEPPQSQPEPVKKSRLSKLVKIFSFIFWIPFLLMVLIYTYLIIQEKSGVSGTEFIGIILAPVVLAIAVIGVIYLVLLILYVLSKGPSRRKKLLSLLVIFLLLGVYGWQIRASVHENKKISQSEKLLTDAEVINLIDTCTATSVQKEGNKVNLLLKNEAYYDTKGNYLWRSTTASATNWNSFVAEVQKVKDKCGGNTDAFDSQSGPKVSWVSVQQATELLQQCKIKTFNYTPSGLVGLDNKPLAGTETGIILQEYPTFSHLFIEQSAETTMVPIARNVQPKCGGPQFYHDNNYEQKQPDGSWQ